MSRPTLAAPPTLAALRTVTTFRTLATLRSGTRAVVIRIHGEEEFAHRLMELGLVPGTEIAVIRRAPLGDPVELKVRGTHFSIRLSEAERIHVDAD